MDPWFAPYLTKDFLIPYDGGNVYIRGALAFVIGACVGSFLNVVALRSLREESWWSPRSHCMNCNQNLGPLDMIPILSYFLLQGKCRHCHEKFSWQYPAVELFTAAIFTAILFKFGYSFDGFAMCLFAATLVTVTITDFREHLIPHEITYPSILLGLIYYSIRHGSPADALIGAGVSYILFDFIDFYGLVAIKHLKDDDLGPSAGANPFGVDESYDYREQEYNPDDDIVMGGGDAVLSAVIACWIGWQQMSMAVVIAFLAGSLMGATYLLKDMHKRDVLKDVKGPAIKGFLIGFLILSMPILALGFMTGNQAEMIKPQTFGMAALGGVAGALFSAVMAGSRRFENRFPFGPALAIGGLIAILVSNDVWYFSQASGINIQGGGF
ncbi:MAG: prepilin peptidase [Candidatus Melainabacteria bacterium]|nr:prepilin peptidase [Candidatus Melainabacteria bacterium]